MNDGILTSGYAPPPMPSPLLGVPTSTEMVDAYGYDADALRYIRAVEAADKARLELGVRLAVNAFVVGLKAGGIWQAIKASCILIGAKTLSGILVPLTGAAPTNFNFVSGDYVRRTGLIGNASTKYLSTNRLPLDDALNSYHMAAWISSAVSGGNVLYMGNSSSAAGATNLIDAGSQHNTRNRSSTTVAITGATIPYSGLFGSTRSANNLYTARIRSRDSLSATASETPAVLNTPTYVFARSGGGAAENLCDARLAWYSVGSSLPLATLELRIQKLVADIQLAVPA